MTESNKQDLPLIGSDLCKPQHFDRHKSHRSLGGILHDHPELNDNREMGIVTATVTKREDV